MPLKQFEDVVGDPRAAGLVRRFHTWPVLREQTVAEHSWQVVRILYAVWPDPPAHLVVAALFHDVGEIATGDLPSYAKARSSNLRQAAEEMENAAWLAMCLPWGVPAPELLTTDELVVLKFCDRMELLEHSFQEGMLGNRFADPMMNRVEGAVRSLLGILPVDRSAAARAYYEKRRELWQARSL